MQPHAAQTPPVQQPPPPEQPAPVAVKQEPPEEPTPVPAAPTPSTPTPVIQPAQTKDVRVKQEVITPVSLLIIFHSYSMWSLPYSYVVLIHNFIHFLFCSRKMLSMASLPPASLLLKNNLLLARRLREANSSSRLTTYSKVRREKSWNFSIPKRKIICYLWIESARVVSCSG